MKTFLVKFIKLSDGTAFIERIIAYDETDAYTQSRFIEIDEAAMVLTVEEV